MAQGKVNSSGDSPGSEERQRKRRRASAGRPLEARPAMAAFQTKRLDG